MNVALVVVTDGRGEYLQRCWASLYEMCEYPFSDVIFVDDSGDPAYGEWLMNTFPPSLLISHPYRQGLVSSVADAWRAIEHDTEADYVFHVEEDFTFCGPTPIAEMVDLLKADPWLAQVVLKRQPWSPEEMAAGGIIEMNPTEYTDHCRLTDPAHPFWVTHRRLFSLNPCVYPVGITFGGADGAERGITDRLLADGYHFGIYGGRHDPPRCLHIGARRSLAWTL